MAKQLSERSGAPLSKATLTSTMGQLRQFFIWLADQPGYRSRLRYSDADYFSVPETDRRIASARREIKGPTIEQVRYVLNSMPTANDIQRRNQALVAFLLLSGARDRAVASMCLKHVDLADGSVFQDAREVRTKNSKTFRSWFFPVGHDIRRIVTDWIEHLRSDLLWGNDDPLFPPTLVGVGTERKFHVVGLGRTPWRTATPIRKIVREAFERRGLPYFNPHSFRNTLTRLGEVVCRTPEELKAWSQNLGHDAVMTTILSYGSVSGSRQQEILAEFRRQHDPATDTHGDLDIEKALTLIANKLGRGANGSIGRS